MRRNKYGENFDEGLPFESDIEFEKLYVPFNQDQLVEFSDWIKNGSSPVLIGGQIGSGKSTFINKAIRDNKKTPDIKFQFDIDGTNLSEGDFIRIILVGTVKYALSNGVDLSFSKLPNELTEDEIEKWDVLIEKLSNKNLSKHSFDFRKTFSAKLIDNLEYVTATINKIIEEIENARADKLIFFASGIDKYRPLSAGFFSLQSSLEILSKHKTFFEVNAVHLFDNKWILKNTQKIFLGTLKENDVINLLSKRKGVYVNSIKEVLKNIAFLSGGNPRQALRILINYEFFRKNKKSVKEALHLGIKKTSQDLFAFSTKPSQKLLNFVEKEKTLSVNLLNLTNDEETAQEALYGNWVFIQGEKDGNKWNTIVNPIIKLFTDINFTPEEYEMMLLKKYGENQDISPTGLTFQNEDDSNVARHELEKVSVESFKLNLTDALDFLSSSLLSIYRQDRVIIAFKDKEIMLAVKAYIFSKVLSRDALTIFEKVLNKEENLASQLQRDISENESSVYSFVFDKDFPEDQIVEVDKIRDRLIYKEILWWIPLSSLSKYLQKWTQLRQLFQIVILDDEILNSLSVKQIEEDIVFYSKVKINDNKMMDRLNLVLRYLESHERRRN